MPETSIQKALREARQQRKAQEALDAAAVKAPKVPEKEEKDEGFFSSFFGRKETIDAAVADAQRKTKNQTTDSNN